MAVERDSELRIGELSRRSGVSPELLRAWERRYGVLSPSRSPGGLRLYSLEDLERVRLMSRLMDEGLAAREAAARARDARAPAEERALTASEDARNPAFDPPAARAALGGAVAAFDEPEAQALIDGLLAVATLDAVLSEVILPFLHDVGERWERGELSVAQEHFASNLIRGRLLGLARGWGAGTGPRALLACPPGERHDLGLISFGLALRTRGWRIDFLGSDTPIESVVTAASSTEPELIVLSAATPELLSPLAAELAALAREHTVALAGAGAGRLDLGADLVTLGGDPVTEAEHVSELVGR
jgi:MerR family transcriptional regulator, light-induced transcriptional regulator